MHGRVRQIGRDINLRHGDTAHARILDLVDQQVPQLALDLIGQALRAL